MKVEIGALVEKEYGQIVKDEISQIAGVEYVFFATGRSNDLFEQNPKTPYPSSTIKDLLASETENQVEDILEIQPNQPIASEQIEEEDLGLIDDKVEKFEDNIYHSQLAEREELHLGNKWLKQRILKEELFNSKKSLRKSIIIKEILDRPLAMRD